MPHCPPRFIYFDLGNVLLKFNHQRSCRQMAAVSGTTPDRVRQVVFESDLDRRYERGEISTDEFFAAFCRQTGTRPERHQLLIAASAIFQLHVPIVPIVAHLRSAGYPLGILSNTCPAHWQYVSNGRFVILQELFDVHALSFQLRALKPERSIYTAAAQLAGVAPEEIFFVDDHAANVAAACQAGFDAVLFSTPDALAVALRQRGMRFNY